MNETLTCNSEGEAVSTAWDEFLAEMPEATLSHLYGWSQIINEAYGHQPFYLSAWRDGAIVGVLPLVYIKSRLLGSTLTSIPFQDYGGIVAKDEKAFAFLAQQAIDLRNRLGVRALELRFREESFSDSGKTYGNKATLLLDISSGAEKLWQSFSPKVRNQVRKAQKSGLSTEIGGSELLAEFYQPFSVNMRDLGSPVHHQRFFKSIFSVLGDQARVALVRDGEQTVGGLILLFYKDAAIVPWASCYRHYFSKCPNNLLYWDAMQYACERGCNVFDFGRSSVGAGTYNFKLQWGAKAFPLYWRLYAEIITEGASDSSIMKMAARLWRHMPVRLSRQIGPAIRKFLPN